MGPRHTLTILDDDLELDNTAIHAQVQRRENMNIKKTV